MADKNKTFMVQANINTVVGIEVQAKNLEEAVQKSAEFKEIDFITIDGEYQDGNHRITGVYEI